VFACCSRIYIPSWELNAVVFLFKNHKNKKPVDTLTLTNTCNVALYQGFCIPFQLTEISVVKSGGVTDL
jgi:hypothetical protein